MSKHTKLNFKRHGGKAVGAGSLWAPIPVDYTKIELDRIITISLHFSIKKIKDILSVLPDTIILVKENSYGFDSAHIYLIIGRIIKQEKQYIDLELDQDLKNFCGTYLTSLSEGSHTIEIKITPDNRENLQKIIELYNLTIPKIGIQIQVDADYQSKHSTVESSGGGGRRRGGSGLNMDPLAIQKIIYHALKKLITNYRSFFNNNNLNLSEITIHIEIYIALDFDCGQGQKHLHIQGDIKQFIYSYHLYPASQSHFEHAKGDKPQFNKGNDYYFKACYYKNELETLDLEVDRKESNNKVPGKTK